MDHYDQQQTNGHPYRDQSSDTAAQVEKIFFELRKVIVGQPRMLERLLVGLLSRGHCLLESVPGLAKTLAAETLATVTGGTFARIQFTPDLLPSDIVGTRVYRVSSEKFDVELGPIFVNFLLTDEINRAPAKVQSALLEVMAEQQVTIGGVTHTRLPKRDLIFFAVKEGIARGLSPSELRTLIAWRSNQLFFQVPEVVDSQGFVQAFKATGRTDPKRYFFAEDRLFHIDGETYALTNQWGDRTLEAVDAIEQRLGGLGLIDYSASSE